MLISKENQKVPNVVFKVRENDEWIDLSTHEIFSGKTVVVFSLPGAYTPTCSSSHLPRYNELHSLFKKHGVDDIYVLSVNDTFTMNAWLADQNVKNIKAIPDGNGEFTDKMGMLVNKENLGFGQRSWRYSMLVKDGVIIKQFIEPEKEGDPFEVSDADTMMKYLAPNEDLNQSITVFVKPGCKYCKKAKDMLNERGLHFEEIILGKDASTVSVRAITGKSTAPQVFIGGQYIGGSEDLENYFQKIDSNKQ